MKIATERIGPGQARKLLASSPGNRNLRKLAVKRYARDMAAGKWALNPQPIMVDEQGQLMDGHNRLSAVVETGKSVEMVVARGVPRRDVLLHVDENKPRNFGDYLKMQGISASKEVTNLTRMAFMWELDERGHRLFNVGGYIDLSNAELEAYFFKHERELRGAIAPSKSIYDALRGAEPRIYRLAWLVFTRIDRPDAELFFHYLKTGESLRVGSPIYALRERLLREATHQEKKQKTQAWIMLALFVKSWNAYRLGNEIHQLRYSPGVESEYPEPI